MKQIFVTVVVSIVSSILVFGILLYIFSNGMFRESHIMGPDMMEIEESTSLEKVFSTEIPDMIEKVNPSVVSIVITKNVPVYEQYYERFNPFGFGDFFSIPRVREKGLEEKEVGGGSGFIVSEDGLIVTNKHVVADQEAKYSVLLNDGVSFEVDVLARDPQLDIAILKILSEKNASSSYKTFPFLEFGDSDSLRLGETVIAIGNALGEFRNSVSVGVISGLARNITATDGRGYSEDLDKVIQTDAAINPGNSGGPLLNKFGKVIGVNVATSLGAENISFALPAQVVTAVVESVQLNGRIVRPYLGVRYLNIDKRVKELNHLEVEYGALVARGENRDELAVLPGSPADIAGIIENDIILSVDEVDLENKDLAKVISDKKVGDSIKMIIWRKGKKIHLEVELKETPNS